MLLFIINFPLALCPHCIFQNILCYCLSKTTALWYITNMNFKTSYVIVYQQRFLGVQKLFLDFITSYVIVYRLCKCMGVTKQNNYKTSYVIVYLNSANHDSNNTEFQNILCYCLSSIFITSLIFLFISKHLMLLFIC